MCGRLAVLGRREPARLAIYRGSAIAEVAGVLGHNRDSGKFFDQVFAHQTGMPARTTGGHDDSVDAPQLLRRKVQAAEHGRRIVAIDDEVCMFFRNLGAADSMSFQVCRFDQACRMVAWWVPKY